MNKRLLGVIKNGGVAAVPTDTVYGLIGLPRKDVIERIYRMKKRPSHKPLVLFVDSIETVKRLSLKSMDDDFADKIEVFWPGALTIILPVEKDVYREVQSESGKIGFRIPKDNTLLELLRKTGPLVSTSCNISDEKALNNAEDVKKVFNKAVDFIVEGRTENRASTVIEKVNSVFIVHRKGQLPFINLHFHGIPVKLKENIPMNIVFVCTGNSERSPIAEFVMKHLVKEFADRISIISRGTAVYPGVSYSQQAVSILRQMGINASVKLSKQLRREDVEWADLILCAERAHCSFVNSILSNGKCYTIGDEDIPDPIGQGPETHAMIVELIIHYLKVKWLKILKELIIP